MRRTLVAVSIAVAGAVGLIATTPASVSADPGSRQIASTSYRLDPANGRLRVTLTLKVTNRTPDGIETYPCVGYSDFFSIPFPTTCERTVRYALSRATAVVEAEATGITATSGSRRLAVSAGPVEGAYRSVTVTLPDVYNGQTRAVKLAYTVRGGAPRSTSAMRTMKAYTSFCVIANGPDAGSVTVRIPKGFAVTTSGAKLRAKIDGKDRVFTSGRVEAPAAWSACFAGDNAKGYRTEKLPAAGATIHLRSWPEDPAWAKGVRRDVTKSMPLLERLTGTSLVSGIGAGASPVPSPAALTIVEASTGSEYAGSYDGATNTLVVGEDFGQPALVEHELAHAWFNGAAFKETWLAEGFAEWAGRKVSGEEPACTRPDVAPGSIHLGQWGYLAPGVGQAERDAVAAQYQAACHAITAVAAAAGDERMTLAIAALLTRRDPYAADPGATRASRTATWKDWLDTVDELALAPAGADDGLATHLVVEYGVASDGRLLAQRTAARRAYHALAATDAGWVVPPAIRAPLATWEFGRASTAIEAAAGTWDATGETDALLAGVDARHGPAADAWQAARSVADLRAAADLAARQLAAARDVAGARDLVDRPLDVVQQVGAFGMDVPSIDAAIPFIRAGDGDRAARIATQVRVAVAGLRAVGQQRLALGGLATLLALAVLGVAGIRHARITARRRAEARASAAVVAVAGPSHLTQLGDAWAGLAGSAHVTPVGPVGPVAPPFPVRPLDDSPTQVWDRPILVAEPFDPEIAALVRPRPASPPTDRGAR